MTSFWIPKHLDLRIAAEVKNFQKSPVKKALPFITVSRSYGCDGMGLAQKLVDELNRIDSGWYLFSRNMLTEKGGVQLSPERLEQLEQYGHSEFHSYIREALFGMPNQRETVEKLGEITCLLAQGGKVVFLGGGGALFTRSLENGVHVRYDASLEWRVQNHIKNWTDKATQQYCNIHQKVLSENSDRESFIKTYLGENISSSEHYDLIFNNQRIDVTQATSLIIALLKARGYLS
ncbi:MAG: hypothetical protein CR997_06550 [Acidobacteria bacterium]|nr:MAG: hypothetical protein CR997_06550 [Acidobacteriota bacterium]